MLIIVSQEKPSGTRIFCSPSKDVSARAQSGAPDRCTKESWSTTGMKKNHQPIVATLSDSEYSEDDNISRLGDVDVPASGPGGLGEEQSSSDDDIGDRVVHHTDISLREEANSLYHLLTHKTKNPFCESCRRAKMKEKRKYSGSYKNTATRWGQLVTGDHIVSTQDNMLGIDGSRDSLVLKDAFSGFKAAYPMTDRKADSTADAIRHFMGR